MGRSSDARRLRGMSRMRQLSHRLSARKYSLGISTRRLWHRLPFRVIAMFHIGDCVVYTDGTRGIVLEVTADRCHVLWEDYFVSWEKKELLKVDEELTKKQTIRVSSHVSHPLS